ncbi:MAG: hypothetical protein LBP53_08100 [Candidatus Peribacteria bacterium]|jgi:hypothetical protein|nr:hypothetical protein [Candidatus Peribacteria bacterium]
MGNESIRQYLQNEDHVVFSPFLDVPRKLYNSLPQRQALLAALKVKKAPTLEQLEKNISDQMRTLLASEQRPQVSCYIDVAEKPEQEDIMLFLFKCWIKETQPDVSFLLKLLTQRSFVVEKCKINSLQDYEDMLNICIKEYENAEEENEEKE